MKSAQSTSASSRASWPLALAVLAAAACASADGELATARESWHGATYDQVLMAWGTPSQSAVDSHTWLGGTRYPGARCDRTLAFRDGRVVDGRWSGDPAFCQSYARRK